MLSGFCYKEVAIDQHYEKDENSTKDTTNKTLQIVT